MIVAGLRFDTQRPQALGHALDGQDALGARLPRPASRRALEAVSQVCGHVVGPVGHVGPREAQDIEARRAEP